MAATRVGERRVTKAQMLEQSCRCTYDWIFGELLVTIDSPRVICKLTMDAFKPFLGQYYHVRLPPLSHFAAPLDVSNPHTNGVGQ